MTEQNNTIDIIGIHTHDRINFKRCRRKWDFASPLRQHLESMEESPATLWFGSGFHFAMEDYHGYRKFSTPMHAFQAYYNAYHQNLSSKLPIDHEELLPLGLGMLEYYLLWVAKRDEFKTVWIDGCPQVEVQFQIELPELSALTGKTVVYQGAFDRIVEDLEGRWWIQDYKTVAQFDTDKLELDPQVSSYSWAAEQYYGRSVEGMLYHQFKKHVPDFPRQLKSGELSTDKRQYTTHALFKAALTSLGFGPSDKLPSKYVDYLNILAEQETCEGDRFIRWDRVRRNDFQKAHEYTNILMEGCEMLSPSLPIYPNPTRDCKWDCPFRTACLSISDGSDWTYLIDQLYKEKGEEVEWRKYLQWEDPQLHAYNQLVLP